MSDFQITDATREAQSVSIGIFGPSGCGKTLSALRLAKGIQSVVGGGMYVIDTEARRSLDYSDTFTFKHVDFKPPFSSLRYLEAINACIEHGQRGPRTIIVDSLSHEHESEGGMLEQFEEELKKFGGSQKDNSRAWIRPKANRRKLVVRMEQMRDVNFILTFRAADKTKPAKDKDGKTEYVHMGFIPIGGSEFVFATKATCFLPPSSEGVPMWNPEFVGEKMMRKLPVYLAGILNDGKPLSEDHGRRLAEWASRGKVATATKPSTLSPFNDRVASAINALKKAPSVTKLEDAWSRARGLRDELASSDPALLDELSLTFEARSSELGGTNA